MADIEMMIDSIRVSAMSYQHVVILKEKRTDRYLPIWIGPAEADAISMKLQNVEVSRPMTHDLICSLIATFGGRVESVVINKLENDCFYAKCIIKTFWKTREIDCRPSDAIAVAVRQVAPIFATDQVLKRAGIILGTETGKILNAVTEPAVVEQKETDNLQKISVSTQKTLEQNEKLSEVEQKQTDNLDSLSDCVREIFTVAGEQARRRSSKYVDTGHLLYALINQSPNTATDILYALGINKQDIMSKLDYTIIDQAPYDVSEISLDDTAKEMIELSFKEAQHLASDHLEPEYLLIGMLREQNGIAGRILGDLAITIDRVYAEIIIKYNQARG